MNTLAGALYKVFCKTDDEALNEMRRACFDYLKLGGGFASGPVALLSGLDPSPLNLVKHFFAGNLDGWMDGTHSCLCFKFPLLNTAICLLPSFSVMEAMCAKQIN